MSEKASVMVPKICERDLNFFIFFMSIIQELFRIHGQIIGFSPKFHPDMDGCGIQCCRGDSKLNFRHHIHD